MREKVFQYFSQKYFQNYKYRAMEWYTRLMDAGWKANGLMEHQ